ncbi:MAG: DUF6220 domain-containing protein, partial [Cyanobacteria bacterium J06626_14]
MHSSSDPIDAVGQSPTDQLPNSISRDNPFSSKSPTIVFYILAVLFNLCLTIQLLTVGLAFFHDPAWWQNHTWLVRGYSGLSLILLVWAYKIALPRRIRIFTVSFPILLGLQFLTIHVQTPLPLPLAIVHPLIGFALFYASTTLVHRTWKIL